MQSPTTTACSRWSPTGRERDPLHAGAGHGDHHHGAGEHHGLGHGRGLTSDDLPRAFERFYLYSRYGTDRPVGTGLGLAIVKELTEAMGGTVSVSSAVGVGTAFTVALPPGEASSADRGHR